MVIGQTYSGGGGGIALLNGVHEIRVVICIGKASGCIKKPFMKINMAAVRTTEMTERKMNG